jgi:hypothetical protein
MPGPTITRKQAGYFNELLIEVNLSFSVVPRPFTAAIIASEIPAAISPYSIAVAPHSSFQKSTTNAFITSLSSLSGEAQFLCVPDAELTGGGLNGV